MKTRLAILAFFIVLSLLAVAAFTSFGLGQSAEPQYAVGLISWDSNDDDIDPGHNKDVGSCSGELSEPKGNGLYDHFDLQIDNAYPEYECQITLVVRSDEEQPVEINDISIETVPPTSDITITIYQPTPPLPGEPWAVLNQGETQTIIFGVHVELSALQNTTYVIGGHIDFEGDAAE